MPVLKSNEPKCSCGGSVVILLVGQRLLLQCHSCKQVKGNPADGPHPAHPLLQGRK